MAEMTQFREETGRRQPLPPPKKKKEDRGRPNQRKVVGGRARKERERVRSPGSIMTSGD